MHGTWRTFAAYLRGFETRPGASRERCQRGLQPTYEDLKHPHVPDGRQDVDAFAAYLRGFETRATLRASSALNRFAAYLRGFETGGDSVEIREEFVFAAYLRGFETSERI